jgi:hypothetical protein
MDPLNLSEFPNLPSDWAESLAEYRFRYTAYQSSRTGVSGSRRALRAVSTPCANRGST